MRHTCVILFLIQLWSMYPGLSSEQGRPLMKKVGDDVIFSWSFEIANLTYITIALNKTRARLFMVSRLSPIIAVDGVYRERLDVSGVHIDQGQVTFTVRNITTSDAGYYLCFDGFATIKLIPDCGQMLIILNPPVKAKVVPLSPAVLGTDLNLECQANSTSLPVDHQLPLIVECRNVNQVVKNQDKAKAEGARLLIHSVTLLDKELSYVCRASDGLDLWSNYSEPYILQPEYPPSPDGLSFNPARNLVQAEVGSTILQNCSASCHPDCIIAWQKIVNMSLLNIVTASVLNITSVERAAHGTYICFAVNRHGNATRPFKVDVQYAPSLQKVMFNAKELNRVTDRENYIFVVQTRENESVSLTCVFDSNPAPKVVWYTIPDRTKPLQLHNLGSHTSSSTFSNNFTIPRVRCEDFKTYVCSASNNLGPSTMESVELKVLCPPKQPINLTVIDVGDCTASLQWIPGFHGGFSQNFHVEYQVATQDLWKTVMASNLENITTSTPLEVTINRLSPGTSYNIRVVAANRHGVSLSETVTVTTATGLTTGPFMQHQVIMIGCVTAIVSFISGVFVSVIARKVFTERSAYNRVVPKHRRQKDMELHKLTNASLHIQEGMDVATPYVNEQPKPTVTAVKDADVYTQIDDYITIN